MPKLNAGSGKNLLAGYVNFDISVHERNGRKTDVTGDLRQLGQYFEKDSFDEILCSHVIEHFYKHEVPAILKQFKQVLKPGGRLVLECPCILGIIECYKNGHFDENQLSAQLYGSDGWQYYQEYAMHRSGWTVNLLSKELVSIGMKVLFAGKGRTHPFGTKIGRDLRLEATK